MADQLPRWPDGLTFSTNDLFAMTDARLFSSRIVTVAQHRVLWANPAFTRIAGYTYEEVLGRRPTDFLRCPDADPSDHELVSNAISEGRSFHVTVPNLRKKTAPAIRSTSTVNPLATPPAN